jgi:hypothetical protein
MDYVCFHDLPDKRGGGRFAFEHDIPRIVSLGYDADVFFAFHHNQRTDVFVSHFCAVEQRELQILFERGDSLAQYRLRHLECASGRGEGLGLNLRLMELGQWNLAHWNFGELWRIGNKGTNKGRSAVARWESSNRGAKEQHAVKDGPGISAPDTISRDHKPGEDRRAVHRSRQGRTALGA